LRKTSGEIWRNLPVIARKDTAGYRASKFITRHKTGVTAAAVIALILVVGTSHYNPREAHRAAAFNDVRSLANSLIFDVHDSIKTLPARRPQKIIVDRALQYLNGLAQESSGDIRVAARTAAAYERVGAVQGDYLEITG